MKKGIRNRRSPSEPTTARRVQILSGIKAGDRVVTQGAYQVKLACASNAIPAHSHEH